MTEAPKAAAVDRADRTSSPGVLALVLVCLVAAVAAFIWLPGDYGRKAVSWTIAGFAVAKLRDAKKKLFEGAMP